MKKIAQFINPIALLLVFAVFVSGCKKDPPQASFTFSPETIIQYDKVQFTNTSIGATSYLWDFNNGALTLPDASPIIQFLDAGEVHVKLTATNGDGSRTSEQLITVNKANNYCKITGSISYIDATPADHVDGYVYDGTEMKVDTAYWSTTGGNHIRFLVKDTKFDKPLLIKFKPNLGLGSLGQSYTYLANATNAGTYDFTLTGGYAGMAYTWTMDTYAVAGNPWVSAPLVTATVTLLYEATIAKDNVYEIVVENIKCNCGDYLMSVPRFLASTNPATVTLHYRGKITPLP